MNLPAHFNTLIRARDYQWDALDALWNYFSTKTGNPIVAMPTGTGKAIVIALWCALVLAYFPGQRLQVLTHVQELIEQNHDKMKAVWPQAPAGIYSAGLGKRELTAPIMFGGIQSLVVKGEVIENVPVPDLIIIDECHLLSPDDTSRYQVYIAHMLKLNPYLKVIGFTATKYRLGQGLLTDGGFFTDVCIDMTDMASFNWFIDQGYLTPLIPRPMNAQIDMTGVHMQRGDYNQNELETAVDKMAYGAINEAMQYCADRRKLLVFCAGKKNAEKVADYLIAHGRKATFVHDGVPKAERRRRIKAYRDGEYDAITNYGILTTGFDDPEIDCIIVLRKTTSTVLWVQMLGRGTRPLYHPGYTRDMLDHRENRLAAIWHGGKRNCLVLDFARNTTDLGPINDPRIPKKGKGGGDAPIKICSRDKLIKNTIQPGQGCGWYNHTSARFCAVCGGQFDFSIPFSNKADDGALIATEEPIYQWYDVRDVQYELRNARQTGKPFIRVTYQCGYKVFFENVLIEHDDYPGKLARDWWRARYPQTSNVLDDVPETAFAAIKLTNKLRRPRKIRVHINTKYPEVKNYEY